MEKKIECEIVEDLLLGYVDGILNNESEKLVEKHLSECEKCTQKLQEIKQDIKENENGEQKEIDYLKKIRRKTRIKAVLIAFGIIFAMVFILYFAKFIKITNIMNKANNSLKSQNYYAETHQSLNNGEVAVRKIYYKDGKYKEVNEIYSDNHHETQSVYYGKINTDKIIEILEKNKKAIIHKGYMSEMKNREEDIKWNRFGTAERNSIIANLGKALLFSIETDTYSIGREYYVIKNKYETNQRWEVWIDKETGLVIKEIQREGQTSFIKGTDIVKEVKDYIQEYKYEFNIVKDEDVQVPDYSNYTVETIEEDISNYTK